MTSFVAQNKKMSHKIRYQKKIISSLFSLSLDCVTINLLMHRDSIQYLPTIVRGRILQKLLAKSASKGKNVNKILPALVHSNLKCINLSLITVNDDTLETLQNCPALKEIDLRNYGNHNITSKGLKRLFEVTKNLLVLDVSFCKEFDDEVLSTIAECCTNLQELHAEGCSISNDGLIFFTSNVKNLKCLSVSRTNVTGVGISTICKSKSCCSLREFRLDNCAGVNDDVLKDIIQNCPNIEILTFYNCSTTDETLVFQDITKNCPNLKQLHWTIAW